MTRSVIKEGETITRAFVCDTVKVISKQEQMLDFTISTERTDRMGDTVRAGGWDLKEYRKNPVILFAHNSRIPPIGMATDITAKRIDGTLKATAKFMPYEMSPFAASIFRMYEERYLRGTSVGFIPLEYDMIKDADGRITGFAFQKQELLEFSAVPIPANPDALLEARSKGINVDPIKDWADSILDDWTQAGKEVMDLYGLDRKGFEHFRRKAAGSGVNLILPIDIQDELLLRNLEKARQAREEKQAVPANIKLKLADKDWELPLLVEAAATEPFGKEELTVEEVKDGDKTSVVFPKVPKKASFALSFFKAAKDAIVSVDLATSVITLKGTEKVVTYKAVGSSTVNDKEDAIIFAELVEVKDVEKPKPSKEDVEKARKEQEAKDKAAADEVAAKEVAAAEKAEREKREKEEGYNEDDLSAMLLKLEDSISEVETLIGITDKNKLPLRLRRKMEYLSMLFYEVVNGKAVTTSTTKTVVEEKSGEEEDEGVDVDVFLESLAPKLATMVQREVNKTRGRLD